MTTAVTVSAIASEREAENRTCERPADNMAERDAALRQALDAVRDSHVRSP